MTNPGSPKDGRPRRPERSTRIGRRLSSEYEIANRLLLIEVLPAEAGARCELISPRIDPSSSNDALMADARLALA
jgi:hypothetical protein